MTLRVQSDLIQSLKGPQRTLYSCMVSWTTASRHITGTHMEANIFNCNSLPESDQSHLSSLLHQTTSAHRLNKIQQMVLTLCLDERFCNLSFGCLNSFVFICPGSQKPDR